MSTIEEMKKALGFQGTLKYNNKVSSLQRQIKSLEKHDRIMRLETAIHNGGRMETFGGISLYFDHIEKSGRSIAFTPALEAQIQTDGSVYSTSKTSGGGSRPTLTRTIGGSLLFGPLGAVGGAMTQKHGKINTTTTVHDDRKIVINIRGDGGFISETVPYTAEERARTFVEKMLNISYDYQHQNTKLTPAEYKARLIEKLASAKAELGLEDKQKELHDTLKQRLELKNEFKEYKTREGEAKKEQQSSLADKRRQDAELWKQEKRRQHELRERQKHEDKNRVLAQKAELKNLQNESKRARLNQKAQLVRGASSTLGIFKRWYANKVVIVLLLIFLFPVGLFLMWKFANWTKKTKWVITIITVLITAFTVMGVYNSPPTIVLNDVKDDTIRSEAANYTLSGRATSMKAATVSINGKSVQIMDGSKFTYDAMLKDGDNMFDIIALNENGKTEKIVTIYRAK